MGWLGLGALYFCYVSFAYWWSTTSFLWSFFLRGQYCLLLNKPRNSFFFFLNYYFLYIYYIRGRKETGAYCMYWCNTFGWVCQIIKRHIILNFTLEHALVCVICGFANSSMMDALRRSVEYWVGMNGMCLCVYVPWNCDSRNRDSWLCARPT